MDTVANGWFTEFSPDDYAEFKAVQSGSDGVNKGVLSNGNIMGCSWMGQRFSLKVERVLFHEKSKFQDILVFKSTTYGNVLVLDNIIQCTERDEFSYQEMLAHLPLFAHECPKNVLIIGGGDGGILREVLKHETVQSVTMCEIDETVIDVSKKYLPKMACNFDDPKLRLHIGDGLRFLEENKDKFDVIITDSSDPIGPAESLFGCTYYQLLKESLTERGVLSSQAESLWLHLDLISHMMKFSRKLFPVVAYASSLVSTYPSGTIGYLIASKDKDRDVTVPVRELSADEVKNMNLRYYNSQVHRAAFVLPQFVTEALSSDK